MTGGRITAGELLQRGYDRKRVIGSLAGAGTPGFLLPPSTIMIIYGVMAAVVLPIAIFPGLASIVPALMRG